MDMDGNDPIDFEHDFDLDIRIEPVRRRDRDDEIHASGTCPTGTCNSCDPSGYTCPLSYCTPCSPTCG
jgi:hypothetical protein